jgi:hypothetical protein
MGALDKRDSERITIRWPRFVGHYRAEYVLSMSPPHRNTELVNALATLPGVISVHTLQNLKGLHISVVSRSSNAGRYVYNDILGVFKRLGYELIEDESQEGSE